ncbi:hypothetical protein HK104_001805 [Borealophlyctis nickersoniae]|nr:hypothetical protein HK104_001805 [Borealophlyctis nickersoniae]
MTIHTASELNLLALSLVQRFLRDAGWTQTLETLQTEAEEECARLANYHLPHGKSLLAILEEHETAGTEARLRRLALDRRYDQELDILGKSKLLNETGRTLDGIHYANILHVTSKSLPSSLFPASNLRHPSVSVLLTGSTDKTARLTDADTGGLLARLDHHNAPILAADFYPSDPGYVVTGGMDGAHHVVDVRTGQPVQSWKAHSKYIVRALFSPHDGGQWLVTGSYDKTVNIYERSSAGSHASSVSVEGSAPQFQLFHTLTLRGTAESICFLPPAPPSHLHSTLVVGSRDDNKLLHIDLDLSAPSGASLNTYTTNMNENGDDWVSFAAMDLAPSPSGRHLACYTDSKAGRIIIFASRESRQAKNLYGVVADEFSRPRCCWDVDGKLLFATSDDRRVYVFEIATGTVVQRLGGHQDVVRGLAVDADRAWAVSCSFDKTVRIWEVESEDGMNVDEDSLENGMNS